MPAKTAKRGSSPPLYNAPSWRYKLRIFLFHELQLLLKTAVEKTQEDGLPSWRSSMSNICTLCLGPIESPDTHEFCILCLGFAHAEAALAGSGCPPCEELPVRVQRARRGITLGDSSRQRPTAASKLLMGQTHMGDRAGIRCDSPPHSPVYFAEESLQPAPGALDLISFGVAGMAISTRPCPYQCPRGSGQTTPQRSALKRRVKPRFKMSSSGFLTMLRRRRRRGYTRIPPVEESIAAQLCPSSASLKAGIMLPSRPCHLTTHIADKAYAASGEAISALHTMAMLQVFQAQLLKTLDEGEADPEAFKDLCAMTDFTLKATKKTAQAIGRSMGFMVVLHSYLWLTLTELKDTDRKTLLNAPLSPSGLFGDAVEMIGGNARHSLPHSAPIRSENFLHVTPVYSAVAQNSDGGALRPLCHFASAWWSVPGISDWVRNIIENSYTLNGVVMSTVPAHNESVMRQVVEPMTARHSCAAYGDKARKLSRRKGRASLSMSLAVPPLEPIEHGQGMDAELFRILSKAVEELDLEWAPPEEPSRSRLDEWFLPGRRQAPRQRSAPFFPEVHEELTKSWRAPYSARLHTTHRSALTAVDGSEGKGYEHLPPLDEAVSAHLCPPAAVGWKTKRALPSKPCRTTSTLVGRAYTSAGQAASALHTMAIFQVFQAKLLRSLDESGIDAPAFRDLRSATDLALRATKATAQAIGWSMASLVVLERHLWLNLTEIKDLDKTGFLDALVSPSGLFGPAVDGFTERFTAAQKSSQAIRHFLPKRSSSASALSRPRPAPAQQNKPATSTSQAAPPKEHRQRSRPAKRPPFPRRQGPRPKIVLDPVTPKTS
ncbi:hypothetical protein DPX16_22710 [Anabarilius grahami]|uniref:Uncharacterized protein n=1 Tax=Anabarilius grahami TaxID=495550 RepID=A0A3N0XXK6_ANAGA|nr:hypothetical protein DPX16_22710 [Anabarilius grahami]